MAENEESTAKERSKSAFAAYLEDTFPLDGRRTRSGIFRRDFADTIVSHLNGIGSGDSNPFRHYIQRTGIKLLDLPEAGVLDVLGMPVREQKKVKMEFWPVVHHVKNPLESMVGQVPQINEVNP